MGAIIPAIGTLFTSVGTALGGATAGAVTTGAVTAGAAGIFSGGGLGLLGGLVGGLGAGMMEKKRLEEKEAQEIRAEERLSASYAGAGDAMRFWQDVPEEEAQSAAGNDPEYYRADPNSNESLRVGQKEKTVLPGQQFKTEQKPKGVYRYDQQTGTIVRA